MQRRLRIALAVTAAAGALALGAGTAFADAPSDGINGANTPDLSSASADPVTGLGSSLGSPTQTSSDADSSDADSDDADSDAPDTDAATSTPGGLMGQGANVSTPSLTGVGK